jgi:hypothetical protein
MRTGGSVETIYKQYYLIQQQEGYSRKRGRLKKLTQIFVDARFVHAVSCPFRTLKHTWRLSAVIRRHILNISEELMAE